LATFSLARHRRHCLRVSVTWIATVAKNWVSQHFGEETGSQILISLLIPFGAYLLAETLPLLRHSLPPSAAASP